jgi:outer membrane immunogenic protein
VRTRGGRTLQRDVSVDVLIAGGIIELGGPGSAPPAASPPATSPPRAPFLAAPGSDWGGTHVGGALGGRSTQCPDFNNVLTVISQTTQINPNNSIVLNTPIPRGADNQACGSAGARAAIMLGNNWQVAPQWVLGLEGDVGFADSQRTINTIPGTSGIIVPPALAANDSVTMKEGWDAGLRARLGYVVSPALLLFGSAGVAWQNVQVTMNCAASGTCGANGIAAFSASASTTMTGWSIGAGIDAKLTGNWVARGEYRYADYGTWRSTLGTLPGLAVTTDIAMRTHTALFGLFYTFNGPGSRR